MFALDLWDSPLMLLGEIALSIAVVAVIMFAARMVNSRSAAQPTGGRTAPSQPDKSTPETNDLAADAAEKDDPDEAKPKP